MNRKVYSIPEIIHGTIEMRINRFVVKGYIGSKEILAHLTNTGRLNDILVKDRRAIYIRIKGRRLNYRLIGVEDVGGYNIVDTVTQNKVFEHLIKHRHISWLRDCSIKQRNPKLWDVILDYIVECGEEEVYIETKSAVLRENNVAMYPDCPSIRGRNQIHRMIDAYKRGVNVYLIFIAALPNVACFKPYMKGDPIIFKLISEAFLSGVPIKAINIYLDKDGTVYLSNDELPLCREWIRYLGK